MRAWFGLSCLVTVLLGPINTAHAEAGGDGGGAAQGGISGIASSYVTKLKERVKKADDAALRGAQLVGDEDYQGAIEQFKSALDLLPDSAATKERREYYKKQYVNASVRLAQQRADEGDYDAAIKLLQDVLSPNMDPDNYEAKRLLERINDPEWYSPAMTPELKQKIDRVKKALAVAHSATELGDYDFAEKEYYKVLNDDHYNEAAMAGLVENNHEQQQFYEKARTHARSEMLKQVAAGWKLPVPVQLVTPAATDMVISAGTDRVQQIENKLRTIIIPSVEFTDTPLDDCLTFLREQSIALDSTPDVANRGISIIPQYNTGGGAALAPAPGGGAPGGFDAPGAGPAGGGGGPGQTRINLKISNVPLGEALRYTTSLAGLKYKVDQHAVLIIPASGTDAEMITNVYIAPPSFISTGGAGGGAAPAADDPFGGGGGGGGGAAAVARPPNAREVLEGAGINFPPGSSAIYTSGTSQLVVRNTPDQLELVEAFLKSIRDSAEKQILITTKFVEVSEDIGNELGFDWLLGPFNLPSSSSSFGAGGTNGNQGATAVRNTDYTFIEPGAASPVGNNPVTAGLRTGGRAINNDSINGLINTANGIVSDGTAIAPAIFSIAGVFTDPQFQLMIRALAQKKGTDLLSAPSVMARPGQRAKIEVIREFIYPTEYDPPELPTSGGTLGGGAPIIVTPANPTAFETRNTGITMEVDPQLGADNLSIDLSMAPEIVEFDGFINYGVPIFTPVSTTGTRTQLTENRIVMPIFSTRRVTTQVTVWDGQTVALGGLIREDVQDVEDKIPLLGDAPFIGRLFRSSAEKRLKRNLTIFVTAQLKDPSGADFNKH